MGLDRLGQGQRRLQPLSQRQPAQAQAGGDLFDARPMPLAQPRSGAFALPLDPQPLGPAVQQHHPPHLPGAAVQQEAALAHDRRYPRPSSSIRVS